MSAKNGELTAPSIDTLTRESFASIQDQLDPDLFRVNKQATHLYSEGHQGIGLKTDKDGNAIELIIVLPIELGKTNVPSEFDHYFIPANSSPIRRSHIIIYLKTSGNGKQTVSQIRIGKPGKIKESKKTKYLENPDSEFLPIVIGRDDMALRIFISKDLTPSEIADALNNSAIGHQVETCLLRD